MITELEKRGLRAAFKEEMHELEAQILETETVLKENPSQHDAWKDRMRHDITVYKARLSGFQRSMVILTKYDMV